MKVSVEGSRYALERRLRQAEEFKAFAASDDRALMLKMFSDQKRYVRSGELRLFDRTTGHVVEHWHRPDLELPRRDPSPTEPATVVEVTKR